MSEQESTLNEQEPTVNANEQTQEPNQEPNDTDELTKLIATIEALEAEVKEAKEAQARANADSYNAQRRMEQETEKAKNLPYKSSPKSCLMWWIT